jgi:hypothetical protein
MLPVWDFGIDFMPVGQGPGRLWVAITEFNLVMAQAPTSVRCGRIASFQSFAIEVCSVVLTNEPSPEASCAWNLQAASLLRRRRDDASAIVCLR